MNRFTLVLHAVYVIALCFSSCSQTGEINAVNTTTKDSTEISVSESYSYEPDNTSDGKSLNDIRFANFTDKDWLDNEYIRTLRKYLDEFNNGIIEDEELEIFKDDVNGSFIIANVEPFFLGGLFIQIIFIDKPEKVFTAWVYSDVDEDAEKVVGYSVRRISLDERKNELTREQILQEMKKHPELKLW